MSLANLNYTVNEVIDELCALRDTIALLEKMTLNEIAPLPNPKKQRKGSQKKAARKIQEDISVSSVLSDGLLEEINLDSLSLDDKASSWVS